MGRLWTPVSLAPVALVAIVDGSRPLVVKLRLLHALSERCWSAMASFCEEVMTLKEAAESEREVDAHADVGGDRWEGDAVTHSFNLRKRADDTIFVPLPICTRTIESSRCP